MFIPDFGGGGAERVAVTLGNAMVRRGVPVDMVAMRAVGPLREKLDPGVRVIDLDAERIRHAAGPLAQYLRTHRPTALVAHMWPLPVVALFARARAAVNARIIGVSHTTWSKAELFGCWRKRSQMVLTTRLFYRHLDAVVAVSSGVADDVVKISGLPRARVRIVYNAICGARDAESPASSGSSVAWMHGSHRKILAVGSLTAMKGFDDLLSAFARVRQRADARLLILGEGPARDALADQIERLGVEDAVEMPGFVADPRAYYRAADLFVLSSRVEGLPTVVVEALEQGTPVVSTDCPSGPREILQEGKHGTLVPVRDVRALADAMEAALASEHDSDALIRRAQDFSVDRAVDAHLDLMLPGRDRQELC